MRYYEIPIKNPHYFSFEISFYSPGLANFNPQEGHIISKDSPRAALVYVLVPLENHNEIFCPVYSLESNEFQFANTLSANKLAILCSVDLIRYVCYIVLSRVFR